MAEAQEPMNPDLTSEAGEGTAQQATDRPQFTVVDKRFWVAREGEGNGREADTTTPTSRLPTYVEKLQEQLQEKDRLLRSHMEEVRHEQAELRRRLDRDLEQRVELMTSNLVTDFLAVLDNLDRALQSAEQHPNWEALLEGIKLVRTQFLNVLERHGLKPLNRLGQVFDPSLDEAITTVEVTDPSQHNLVLQEWEKGYTLQEKLLRPAKVVVGKMLAED
jgi:molecular chaperone GrpE (heat shock protein)